MPSDENTIEFRIVLHRIGQLEGMFDAPGFSVLIQAKDAEDALAQAEQLSSLQGGKFRVVDVYPAVRAAVPPRSD